MDWKEGVELLLPVREVVFGFWIFIPSKPTNEVTNAMVFILISFLNLSLPFCIHCNFTAAIYLLILFLSLFMSVQRFPVCSKGVAVHNDIGGHRAVAVEIVQISAF